MKPLTLFITNSPGITWEFIKVTMKEMQLDTHLTPKVVISLPRKLHVIATKDNHAAFSLSFILLTNSSSRARLRI